MFYIIRQNSPYLLPFHKSHPQQFATEEPIDCQKKGAMSLLIHNLIEYSYYQNPKTPIGYINCCARHKMKPDKTENQIRFGCGFTFGMVLGFAFAVQWVADNWGSFVAIAVVFAIACGLLAMKYGDAFLHSLKDKLWWFWWW